jgi:hypothetical protein
MLYHNAQAYIRWKSRCQPSGRLLAPSVSCPLREGCIPKGDQGETARGSSVHFVLWIILIKGCVSNFNKLDVCLVTFIVKFIIGIGILAEKSHPLPLPSRFRMCVD